MAAIEKLQVVKRSVMADGDTRAAVRAQFREEISQRIASLDLASNVIDLDIRGYTVIRNAAPMEFFRELRARILELSEERKRNGVSGDRRGVFSDTIDNVFELGRVFELAAMNDKVNTLMAYLLGDGYVVNKHEGIVVDQGGAPLFIHCDNAYIPDPFPLPALTATVVWFSEDMTMETGASRVIPGSHRFARHPNPGEGEDAAIPLECPAGSVAMWNGATWHGNCGRTAAGERVTLHTSYCRMHIRPFADNDRVPKEIVDRNPPLFAQLLGRGLPQGNEGDDGPDPQKRAHAARLFTRRL
jgi:ectoine hydroxylase-related dioxygenase (phytanoyl-CoA dioxygenase family)